MNIVSTLNTLVNLNRKYIMKGGANSSAAAAANPTNANNANNSPENPAINQTEVIMNDKANMFDYINCTSKEIFTFIFLLILLLIFILAMPVIPFAYISFLAFYGRYGIVKHIKKFAKSM